MKTPKNMTEMTAFGQAALAVDADFALIEQLSGQIDRASIDSEQDLERARQLLLKFSECGLRIAENLPAMAKALDDSRVRAETAAKLVGERAAAIQQRHEHSEHLLKRFNTLGESIRTVTQHVAKLPKKAGELSVEEREVLLTALPELNVQLDALSNEANKLREDARTARMRTLERNADSLSQKLKAARSQFAKLTEQRQASLN